MAKNEYHFSRLNSKQKRIYNSALSSAQVFQKNADFFGISSVGSKDIQPICEALLFDHPELFYLGLQMSATSSLFGVGTLHLQYNYSKDQAKKLQASLNVVANDIATKASRFHTDFEKILFVHDYLASTVTYDMNEKDAHNALGPLLNHRGVCQGIAAATKLILDIVGVECAIVMGEVRDPSNSGPHAWNLVCIDKKWYHLDVTLDLKQGGMFYHTYFLINDADCFINHRYSHNDNEKCESINENYFFKKKAYFASFDLAAEYIVKQLATNNMAEVKMLKVGTNNVSGDLMKAVSLKNRTPMNYFIVPNVTFQIYGFFKR